MEDIMRKKIIEEIRRQNVGKDYLWRFQQYNPFRFSLNPVEQREFDKVMSDLCDEGIFTAEKNGSVMMYRLIEKGERIIYS